MATGLAVDGLVVRYPAAGGGTTTAVDDVTMAVAPGEVLALLGPSGCGKSSLLRAVAGLEPPVAGRVTWDGADLGRVPVHRRGFGLMFQDGQLFPHRDVAGNVGYGLRGLPGGRAARVARVADLLDLVGLAGYDARPVATLSGGERQRVALARALAPQPRLLLLDEPLSALDRSLRERLADDLRAVLVATGTTALFVTHDQDEAFTVADRVAVMSAGQILQADRPDVLWRHPVSRTVAEFLGYQSFLPAASLGDGSTAPVPGAQDGTDERPASFLAVGPDGWRVLGQDDDPGAAPVWQGTVVGRRARRGAVELTVDVDELSRVVARPSDARSLPGAGDAVRLAIDPAGTAVVPA